MKFISECYNFKVIHTDSLFNLLYSLINWDVDHSCEIQRLVDLDSNSDCFRVRLVTTLLDSIGRYFMRGRRRLLLDRFLVFFQRYILSKNYILMDLEFTLLDTFDLLRPKQMPRIESFQQADGLCKQILEIESAYQEDPEQSGPRTSIVREIKNLWLTQPKGKQNKKQEKEEKDELESAYEGWDEDPDKQNAAPADTGAIDKQAIREQQKKIVDEYDQQEVDAFDAEFAAMMSESATAATKNLPGRNIM